MDTPLVKILLIAAAIAITVGVTVLAWSIFNEGSAEVSTDQDDRAISNEPGTKADGVRARVDNARACEALGSAHWIEFGTGSGVHADTAQGTSSEAKLTAALLDATPGDNDFIRDHPATRTNEGDSHCAVAADTRDDSGLTRRVILPTGVTGASPAAGGSWKTYDLDANY